MVNSGRITDCYQFKAIFIELTEGFEDKRLLKNTLMISAFFTFSCIGVGVDSVPKPLYFCSIRISFKIVPYSNSELAAPARSTQPPQPKPTISSVTVGPFTLFILLV